jgi:hypothetical protein
MLAYCTCEIGIFGDLPWEPIPAEDLASAVSPPVEVDNSGSLVVGDCKPDIPRLDPGPGSFDVEGN